MCFIKIFTPKFSRSKGWQLANSCNKALGEEMLPLRSYYILWDIQLSTSVLVRAPEIYQAFHILLAQGELH